MSDQTTKKDPDNRGHRQQLKQLRSIWQGRVESNHDLRFWRPLY